MTQSLLSIIIPAFNEADNIALIYNALSEQLNDTGYKYELLYIDDGSADETLKNIQHLAAQHEQVKYVSFTRNFGKESAILAGLQHAKGEATIIIDADLQHPSMLLPEMIKGYEEGYDQVLAQRDRKGESRMRAAFSDLYYSIMNKLADVDLQNGVGDFRLLSRRAVQAVLSLSEGNRFSKGIFSWIGFQHKVVFYENVERQEGESKWSFAKLLNYGIEGLVSFNHKPLRICLYTGLLVLLLSIFYITITFIQILQHGIDVPGYFTTISAVLFLGGVQLLSLGVIGEYIGRIYYESKQRPHYLVQESNTSRSQA
ncbi:glycosyltransferase family 2 protein [Thalassobacillus sp. CUG 92003]|uniref:glycosyltransferase family 2 protein n=1 Tax=Thalassobacillus sp. CUG 92003 TaxID=2736641 RepID=UPI0015E6BBF6|nr:glycosyltransferase family 2 protein [Thalassobacillus sp. CUG 92003]